MLLADMSSGLAGRTADQKCLRNSFAEAWHEIIARSICSGNMFAWLFDDEDDDDEEFAPSRAWMLPCRLCRAKDAELLERWN